LVNAGPRPEPFVGPGVGHQFSRGGARGIGITNSAAATEGRLGGGRPAHAAYLETAGDNGGRATPVDVVVAMDKCKSDPASAIPVLEEQLKAAKLSLPPRG
jgi:hypothetical protein